MRLQFQRTLVILCLCAAIVSGQTLPAPTMLGFDRGGSDRERALEKQFDSYLNETICGIG